MAGVDITADADDTCSVALGDVDGDGDLDLVAGNYAERQPVLPEQRDRGPVDRRRRRRHHRPMPVSTWSTALGDVDGDGDLDLVAGEFGQANRLYLNNGTRGPLDGVPASAITSDVRPHRSMALGDVDGDGDLDLVDGNASRNRLYLNNGTADPWSGVTGSDITLDADSTQSIALGDVDGDGDLDLVGRQLQSDQPALPEQRDRGPLERRARLRHHPDANFTRVIALGDVDGDGDLDLVDGNDSGHAIRLYLNNGTADPWNGVIGSDITPDRISERALTLGDVDGDGDLDLVSGNQSGINRLYLNNGTAAPFNGVIGSNITADAHTTRAVSLADMDGDGDLDLVVGNDGQANRLYPNNGTADPWNGVTGVDVTADVGSTLAVSLGDVNRDGILDVVAGNYNQINRLYRPLAYDTSRGRATSLRVDAEVDPITNATLTAIAALPPNTAVDYWLSNDGGARWYQVRPGVTHHFPSLGTDLRWRAELGSLSPVSTPSLDQIQITTQFQPVAIGDRVWQDLDEDGIQDAGEPGFACRHGPSDRLQRSPCRFRGDRYRRQLQLRFGHVGG